MSIEAIEMNIHIFVHFWNFFFFLHLAFHQSLKLEVRCKPGQRCKVGGGGVEESAVPVISIERITPQITDLDEPGLPSLSESACQ